MKEADIIARTHEAFGEPITFSRLVDDLKSLGVKTGDVLLVHSSLSAIGWICGGAETLVHALLAALGEAGTLVMPAHSGDVSDPGEWENPPVPDEWKQIIRNTMPAFDPELTSTRGVGAVPEYFRTYPGVRRSSHPMDSFIALGSRSEQVTLDHRLDDGMGEQSPLGRVYELDGRILLIGCGHGSNSSLHLAEHHGNWPGRKTVDQGSPMRGADGETRWTQYTELDYDTDDFPTCGGAFEAEADTGDFVVGKIGLAESRLIRQRAIVDFAAHWFSANRGLVK